MKNLKPIFIIVLFGLFTLPQAIYSQGTSDKKLNFEVNRIYPYILLTKEELKESKNLTDLNRHYKSSWIKEYVSVEISTKNSGKTIKSSSNNNILSQEQKDIISMADAGEDVSVKVKYIPKNTLTHNDAKEINFAVSVDPQNKAKFLGGQQQLIKYLQEKAIDKIPTNSFKGYDLVAIKFTINEDGEVINAHVFEALNPASSGTKINNLLLEAIQDMPQWKPAEYASGLKVKQEFVLTVGNMENCMVNLLNIERDGTPRSAKTSIH